MPEKTLKASKNSKVKGIGGPILVDIDVFEITPKLTLKISEYEDRFNTLYITDKYLEKNKKINKKHLSKIAVKAFNNKLSKSPVAVNTIDKILKNNFFNYIKKVYVIKKMNKSDCLLLFDHKSLNFKKCRNF